MPCQGWPAFALVFWGGNRPHGTGNGTGQRNITRRPRISARAETSAVDVTAQATKRALRESLLEDRVPLMAAHAGTARLAIRDRYLAAFDPPPGTVVSAFWPMPGELDL